MADHPLVVVAGAGGFIGGHLVAALRRHGRHRLRAVDIKPVGEWWQHFSDGSSTPIRPSVCSTCSSTRTCSRRPGRTASGVLLRVLRLRLSGPPAGNTRIEALLGWEPSTRLRDGLAVTYRWIRHQIVSGAGVVAR